MYGRFRVDPYEIWVAASVILGVVLKWVSSHKSPSKASQRRTDRPVSGGPLCRM